MRLGQLARKLEVNPGRLMEVLKDLSIETDRGLNTQLDDQKVKKIEKKLVEEPEPDNDQIGVEDPSTDEVPATENETITQKVEQHNSESDVKEKVDADPEIQEVSKPEVELIKAPKVQLPGLKVVGKIDLPEIEKKEPKEEKGNETNDSVKKPVIKVRKPWDKGKRPQRKQHQSYQEKRNRDERTKRREKEIQQLELKKKKEQYYKESVQTKVQTSLKPKTLKKKEQEGSDLGPPTPKSEPKSLLGKFWLWLNT
jgi:hypothetical protein